MGGRQRGFTLTEIVVALAILAVLISIAVPRYLGTRKSSYKVEADNMLQEVRTLEWAYYQQFGSFDLSGNSIGFAPPGQMHWGSPTFGGSSLGSVSVMVRGAVSPLANTDSIWVVLYSDGSASGNSSF